MSKVVQGEAGSFHSFLSEGCKLCQQGAKMVLFITGICPKDCFYCPVSEERRKDVTYANERKIISDQDVVDEALQMDALGTGITGGEPLLRKDKVIHYIRLLKDNFGLQHHIHMYTSMAPDYDTLKELADAGLDEIRFHPPVKVWDELEGTGYANSIRSAKELGIETGIEIPSIAGVESVGHFANSMECFLNLNELEFSDTNSDAMIKLGYSLIDDVSNAVAGSEEHALEVARNCERMHFCSSSYKDAVQLRRRLIRISGNTARPFDEIGEEGTVYYGHIECIETDQGSVLEKLTQMEVPADMMEIKSKGIDLAWWILEDIAEYIKESGIKLYIIERYPFEEGLIVEKIPL
ncbi:radical SAM protein [Methanolobus sediminis]|uniref:Radical SAM protein n=1 Tax=Methanolobus sediminis TaxID=3072978 RepID=A0AA51UM52_9EURY|nr:radical SAM protein [Methanolobus sediminis]WMW25787.1 radical SAM protein [Methanolobus sediminis]